MKTLLAVCVLFTAAIASAQTSFITGFELGTAPEGFINGGSVQGAVVRSGAFAYHANPVASNQSIGFASIAAGGAYRQIFKSSRFYIQVAALPSGGPNASVAIVRIAGAATFNPEVDLQSDGTLTLADSLTQVIAHSTNALTVDGLWHRIEFDVGHGLRVYVDGALWASGGSTAYPVAASITFGAEESPTFVLATADLYFDDILIASSSFADTGLPGDGHDVLLTATLTLGSNYQTGPYLTSGIPSSALISATEPVCVDEQTGRGKTNGSISSTSNPTGLSYSFDFGSGELNTLSVNAGAASPFPSLNLSSAAIMSITESKPSSQIITFAGLYVDYR